MTSFQKHAIFFIVAIAAVGIVFAAFGSTERIKPTQDIKNFSVTLNFVHERDIVRKCDELGVEYESDGCNAFHSPRNHCDIYVMAPRYVGDTDKLEIIGHELLHCRYGKYHE